MEMNDTSVNDNSSDNVNISEIEEKSFTYFYCPKTEKLIMNCEDSRSGSLIDPRRSTALTRRKFNGKWKVPK